MILVAGLATANHPYAGTEASVAILRDLVAVPQAAGPDPRQDRYRLAARWCEAGPFLPLSWTLGLSMHTIGACSADAVDAFRGAIEAATGQIEFAFRIEGRIADDPYDRSGRAYLRRLTCAQGVRAASLDRLMALADALPFSVSLVSRRQNDVSGLIRCRATDADRVRQEVETLGRPGADLRIAVAGPLPPFGAGMEAVTRTGLSLQGGSA